MLPRLSIVRYDSDVPSVRKAVFPAAGLGTRFLPATKAQPKEMLPLVDKPIIQYGVEEAVASGIDNILLVTGRGKNAIEDHFDVSVGDQEDVVDARGDRFLDAVLDDRLVHQRQHFLRLCFGGREKPGAETCGGKHGFSDGGHGGIVTYNSWLR